MFTIQDRKTLRESVEANAQTLVESAPAFDEAARQDLRDYIESRPEIAEMTDSGNFDMEALPKVEKGEDEDEKEDDEDEDEKDEKNESDETEEEHADEIAPEDVHPLDDEEDLEDTGEDDRDGDMGITPGQFPH